ncbi:YeiH family protein [Leucobacter sp. M11]|uniref:YeiH family protein n=1 Tax=Leucobacter sp. M11 TaxID=2993565 RepID=UPI002D809C96|nr:putative sulfate exporter family transporter [Leucobacter sp. M11]MEB4613443.1 putative sulfate exporter family transporter [Leucobacter sp. M11]
MTRTPTASPPRFLASPARFLAGVAPGLLICLALAATATVLSRWVPILGSAVPAILLGVLLAPLVRRWSAAGRGITFSSKFVLQLSVVLLGSQLSLGAIARVGLESLPVMLVSLAACLIGAWLLGRWLGITGDLKTLIGVGTGICGASAIAAVSPVIGAVSADIAYAISTIFLFNILAVLVFPAIGTALGMSEHTFGLFAGTAINDTSSVVAAASVFGAGALGFAVVVKLVRTLMIIPISVALAIYVGRHGTEAERLAASAAGASAPPPAKMTWRRAGKLVPWFLIGFLVVAAVGSLGIIPEAATEPISRVSVFLIAAAMAGIGLSTDLGKFRSAGLKPLLLGCLLWLVVTGASLLTLWATGALAG